jgi:hypothetical protein
VKIFPLENHGNSTIDLRGIGNLNINYVVFFERETPEANPESQIYGYGSKNRDLRSNRVILVAKRVNYCSN